MGTKASIMKFAIINDPKRLWDDGKKKVDNFYQMGKKINEAWEILLSQEVEDDVSEKLFQIPFDIKISHTEENRDRWLKSKYFDSAFTATALCVEYIQYVHKRGPHLPHCSIRFYIDTKTYGSFNLGSVVFNDEKLSIGSKCFFAAKGDYEEVKKHIIEIKELMGLEQEA